MEPRAASGNLFQTLKVGRLNARSYPRSHPLPVIVAPKQRTAHARASPPQQSTQPLPMDARIVYPLLSHADDDQVPNALWVNGADFASLHWKEGLLMSVVNPYPVTMSAAERQELPEPPFEAATRVVVRAYCSDDVPTGHVRVPAGCLHALQLRPLSQVQLIPWAGEPTKSVASVRLIVSASNKSFDWPAWIARQAPTHVLTSGSVLTVGAELVRVEVLAAVPVTSQPAPPPLRATSVFGTLSAVSDGVVSASAVRSALGVGGGRDASASLREANADSVVLDDSACVLLSSLASVACATVVRAVPVPRVDVALPEPSIDQLAAVQAPFEVSCEFEERFSSFPPTFSASRNFRATLTIASRCHSCVASCPLDLAARVLWRSSPEVSGRASPPW